MTTKHWLGTAAIVLAIGTGSGVAFAQNPSETKHEEGRSAASQHEMNRGETKGGSEAKQGAKEGQREGQSAQQSTKGEREQSAQREQHEGRDAKESSKESSKSAAESKQNEPTQKQGAAEERKNENKNAAETNKTEPNKAETNRAESNKAEPNRAESNKAESNRAAQSGQQKQEQQADHRNPANATQQSQGEHKNPASEQATGTQQGTNTNQSAQTARPNNTTTQQNSQTDPNQRNAAGQPQNNATGQAQNNQTGRGSSSTSVAVNSQQRTRVFDQLHKDHDFNQARTDVDIRVNIGERLPERVRPRPLPSDIVTIVPEYRGYDYTVVHDEIAIVDPRSREIVDVIPQGGGSSDRYAGGGYAYGGNRVTLTDDQRQILFRSATATSTVGTASSSSGTSSSGPTCLSLKKVPDELAKSNPELASYQYLAIGDQVVLVDPQNQKIVQVIDQQQQQQSQQ